MLHLHRSTSGLALARGLCEVLAVPLPEVFAAEVVAVPAKGVERWLSQRLSHHLGAGAAGDGVCAHVQFPSPAELLDTAVASGSPELAAAVEAWQPGRAVWHLLDVLDELPPDECLPVLRFLGDRSTSERRYALASRVVTLFAGYASDRPELLAGWAAGTDDVPADLSWQPELWRRLRDRLGPSPAELHAQACALLREHPEQVPLPARLSLYGVTRVSQARLNVVAALAAHRDVHLFVHHPGPALWDAVGAAVVASRADDASSLRVRHPLLASLSRDVRELQQRLQAAAPDLVSHLHEVPVTDGTVLHRLQRDLHRDVVTAAAASDRSVQVHACHGPARQVEVLREVILQILRADPTLEPRDVLVMCPDVETYAPLITAAFDTDSHPGGRLRVSIADRSPRQTNPLLGLAARLLELASSRVTGAQVLDLAGSPAVRRRFWFSDDDVEQLRSWVVATHINWGLDGAHRAPWDLAGVEHGTWRTGMDRLLTGVALGESDTPYAGTLPLDGIDSTDIELAGRCAELVDRLDDALRGLRGRQPVGAWMTSLEDAVLSLGDVPADGQWQRAQLVGELSAVHEAAAGSGAELTLADVVALVGERLEGRPTRTSFRTGGLTVCTLTPMRSVPHRVVCLLGMDDAAFPRHSLPDGDDLLARDPRLGERDPRSEDRQLFLDALLAAGEHLVITYSGAHVRTGAALPPAVPVGELLDALPSGVVVHHPLQPFDPRNFTDSALGVAGPFSCDLASYAGAVSLVGTRKAPDLPFAAPLPPAPVEVIELRRLAEFFEHPAKGYLRQRLEVYGSSHDEEPSDAIVLELDQLQQWSVGDRVLRARLQGADVAAVIASERARGQLPPVELGTALLRDISGRVDGLLAASAGAWAVPEETVEIDLPDVPLLGSVRVRGDVLLTVTYSNVKAKQRLRAWVELLALTAAAPGRAWTAAVVGRAPRGKVVTHTLGPVSPGDARTWLGELVALRSVGLRTPLPMPVSTSEAYAAPRQFRVAPTDAIEQAAKQWTSTYDFPKEDADPENVLLWGAGTPFASLWEWVSPLPLPGGYAAEPSDFGRCARVIWQPLLDAEVRS